MNNIKNTLYSTVILIILELIIFNIDEVKSDEINQETNLTNNLNLQQAKQFRLNIIEYLRKGVNMLDNLDKTVINEIVNITQSDQINYYNYNLHLTEINNFETNVSEIALKFQEYYNSSDAIIYDIKNRIDNLLNDINNFRMNLNENTMKALIYLDNYYNDGKIIIRYENVSNYANQLIIRIIDKEQSLRESDCIDAIKRKHFELAEKHLNQIIDDKRVNNIVNKTYAGISNNFYLLLKFNKYIKNITRSFYIFNELNKEMRNNCDVSINKLYAMITFLNDKISNNKLQDPEIITKATRIIESLKIDIKTFSIMEMADILEETKIEYSDIKFLNKIYSLDQKLTFDIFYESYQFSIDNENVTQKFENILKIILNEYLNDSKKLFDYVFFIKKFFRKINREEFIEDFMNIIRDNNSIPETIRSILFAEKLCIYNEENKILSSLKSDYGYGIKLITPKLFHNKDFWMLNNKEENTYEINNYHYEQYSLALMDDNIPEVSIENKEFAKNNLWVIEPNYDYALIKNVKNNKYLVASPNLIFTDDEYHNRIFSTKWRIKDCSDCTERSLFCDNADCIKMDNWCDGVSHCSDGSDENNCCSRNSQQLQCKHSYYDCFEKFQLCDGINDCSDRTDELYCRE